MICTSRIYDQGDEIKEDEMGWACDAGGEKRNAYRVLVGKPEGTQLLGRPARRMEDNIKVTIKQGGVT
jgi:hypothetical protein